MTKKPEWYKPKGYQPNEPEHDSDEKRITVDGEYFRVFTPFNGENVRFLKSCPGRRFVGRNKGHGGYDKIPITATNIEKMKKLVKRIPEMELDNIAKAILEPRPSEHARKQQEQLRSGHDYLMTVKPSNLTVEDALEAFGFGRNGLKRP